jgi:signal transduction histidine kinase
MKRLTIRTRLTLTYGALFLCGGVLLIAIMVAVVRNSIYQQPSTQEVHQRVEQTIGHIEHDLQPEDDPAASALEEHIRQKLRDDSLQELTVLALCVLGVLIAFSGGAGWWVTGRVLRRLRKITEATRQASETTLHKRLNLHGPDDELKELGDTFDAMLARLDSAFDGQRRFVANASHELRTPLTVIRTAIEVTLAKPESDEKRLRAMTRDVYAAAVRAEELIDSLLVLARSEQPLRGYQIDDVADLAAEAIEAVLNEAAELDVTISQNLEPLPVWGDVPLLARAVGNLVENAVRYNVSGGLVTVSTNCGRLTVCNDGPMLDPSVIEELFEPFHRGAESRLNRPGAGLGLSIVRSVARAHSGTVHAKPRPEGGLVVTLILPTVLASNQGTSIEDAHTP